MQANLAIIGSCGHYYTLLEAVVQLNVLYEESILLITYSPYFGTTKASFDEVITHPWKKVIWFRLWHKSEGLLKTLKKIEFLKVLVKQYSLVKFDRIITSQYNTYYIKHIVNSLFYEELICLDEGNAVFNHIEQRKQNLNKKATDFTTKLLRLKTKEVSQITYFSNYDISPSPIDKWIKCEFEYSKKQSKHQIINYSKIYFIGSPYVEDRILEFDYYLKLLGKIYDYLGEVEVFYFTHRREQEKYYNQYNKILSFNIENTNLPIELFFTNSKEIPGVVCGFYTAALLNLSKSYQHVGVQFISFKFDFEQLLRAELKSQLSKIYQVYEQNDLLLKQL